MLEERKLKILNLIVGDYIRIGAPIASEAIARAHSVGVSSATIRNDVAELEQEGYISRPHQSAGSVPSDMGYRVYVETVAVTRVAHIPFDVRNEIRTRLAEVERDVDEWTSVAAAVLARFVGSLAIATFPKAPESRVRHIELVPLQDFLALLIVIFEQTRMRRQLVRLSERVPPGELQAAASRVNGKLQGLTYREIESREMRLSPLEDELVATTVNMLSEEDRTDFRDHYLDGLRNLLDQPEFAEKAKVRAVVEGVEDGSLARAILDEVPATGVVRVVIGQENREDLLWPLSVVIGRYGIPGQADGALGAVGPVRMAYEKAIAGVGMVTEIMNDMVEVVRA
jgi:heat-inducible transcriptional repressor